METAVSGATERATLDPASIAPAVEAILMSVERPVSAAAVALGLIPPTAKARAAAEAASADGGAADISPSEDVKADPALVRAVEDAIKALNAAYSETGRSFRIEHVAGGYRLMTLPQFARAVGAFQRARQSTRLTKAAIETLAIIAYKQPMTRADLEAIRGVACGEVLRSLMDRRLITIKGRAEELGRPLLYGTTKQFLDAFGLASLNDLPQIAELKSGDSKPQPAPNPAPAAAAAAASAELPLVETVAPQSTSIEAKA